MDQGHSQIDDDASDKLWEIYLAEAQRYDEGLLESWKEDMDVTLVFSGLFATVLSGFVLESYKNLQPNYPQISAEILQEILSRLTTASTGPDLPPRLPLRSNGDFVPSASDVACSVLWFMSLTLALASACLATLIQQWTRHFLHRTTLRRSPTARARLFSFLYFGLKDLGMHTIVEVTPYLLHLSLLLFFSGLVAFLWSVNQLLTRLVVGALVLIIIAFVAYTILPVIRLDSPFYTPMSPVFWSVWQSIRSVFPRTLDVDHEARLPPPMSVKPANRFTDGMIQASNSNYDVRESTSLVWTLRSLKDDTELLSFVEALLNAIWGSDGPRKSQLHLLRPLLETTKPQINIIVKTMSLLSNAENPWFTNTHRARCRTVCPELIWAIANILIRYPNKFSLKTPRALWFSKDIINQLMSSPHIDDHYKISTVVLCRLNAAVCVETSFNQFLKENRNQEVVTLPPEASTLFGEPLLPILAMPVPLLDGSEVRGSALSAIHASLMTYVQLYRSALRSEYLSNSSERQLYRFEDTESMFDIGNDTPSETPSSLAHIPSDGIMPPMNHSGLSP